MNRHGMALIATLWVVVGIAGICTASLAVTRAATWATRNRLWAMRAGWAREACWAIARQRYMEAWEQAGDSAVPPDLAPTTLGGGMWCSVSWQGDGRRLNLNRGDRETLARILPSDSLVDALLDWRDEDGVPRARGAESAWYRAHQRAEPRNGDLADMAELTLIRGFDSALVERLSPFATVTDTSVLDLNAADPELIGMLSGVPHEMVDLLRDSRRRGEQIVDLPSLLPRLSPPARRAVLAELGPLQQQLGTGVRAGIMTITGGIAGVPLESTARIHLLPSGRRLAVLAVEAM